MGTGLKEGIYRDIISGSKSGGSCTGKSIKVKANGKVTVTIPARDAVVFRKKTGYEIGGVTNWTSFQNSAIQSVNI